MNDITCKGIDGDGRGWMGIASSLSCPTNSLKSWFSEFKNIETPLIGKVLNIFTIEQVVR